MTWRFSISTDGGTGWTVVSPLNGSKLKIEQSRDLDAGQVFFRKKLTGKPMLGGDDFKLIDAVRRNPSRRCEELLIKCERDCGQWQEYWRGRFSVRSGTWDLDSCTVALEVDTVDRYTCILDIMERRVNLLNTDVNDVAITALPSNYRIVGGRTSFGSYPGPDPASIGYVEVDSDSYVLPVNSSICSGASTNIEYFWREEAVTDCVNGLPVMPAGDGWINVSGDITPGELTCVDDGRQRWARVPAVPWPWPAGSFVMGGWNSPSGGTPMTEPVTPACSDWYLAHIFNCPGGFNIGFYLCLDAILPTAVNDRARRFEDCVNRLLVDCELTVASDFFEWDPVGDAPGYSPGINYVTGQENRYADLLLLQNTDAADPNASNPATIGEATLTEVLTMLRNLLRLLWDIDDAGRLRIEHCSYWAESVGLDLSAQDAVNEPLVMASEDGEIPKLERGKWASAQARDFVGLDIQYQAACATTSAPRDWEAGRFASDISYVMAYPDEIGKDGFILIAARDTGSGLTCIIGTGILSGGLLTNEPLSMSTVQRDFWPWDRFLPSANMNGVDTDFPNFLPTVQQEGASFRACCSLLAFDPRRRINGALARRLGVLGVVESVSHDLYTDRITLVLRYPY